MTSVPLKRFLVPLFVSVALLGAAALPASAQAPAKNAVATFAGGCFWCMEEVYDKLPGIVSTTSGYMGGKKKNPTYEEVSAGITGHTEVVQVIYDPAKVSYEKLLDAFWLNIDPTVKDRQFCDSGSQYRTEIFVHNDEQRKAAEASKAAIEKTKPFKEQIVTPITAAGEFWPAEEYHQDYHQRNPVRYKYYKTGCGREARLKQLWGNAATAK
jgi:peptide-methionine (S)-S-oxide reductase